MESDNFLHTVNQIIDANIDNGALFQEVCNLSKWMHAESGNIILPSTSSSCGVFNNNLSVYWNGPGFVSTASLAKQLIVMSEKCNEDGLLLLNDIDMEKLQVCLCHMMKIKYKDIDIQLFSSMLLKNHLQIEIMWQLHLNEILSFATYMESKLTEDSVFKENLAKDLASLFIGTEKTHHRRQSILSGYIVYFVKKSFRAQISSSKKIFVSMLDRALKDFLESTENFKDYLALPTLSQLEVNLISEERVKKYSRHAISQILCYNADQIATEVLKLQMDWKSVNVFGARRMLLTRLFDSLECKEVLEELASCLSQSKINSSSILTYISVMCIVFPLSATEMKEYIQAELSTGLENSDFKKLSGAFLVARLSASVCQESFGSYNSWFESTFNSTNCSLMASRPKFSTLVKFLTSLVPTDDAEYLKVHTLHKPLVPPKCGDLLEDYILLAKTRLKDLKSPGLRDGKLKMNDRSDPAEEDVQKMLSSYEETGKIPSSFFRAWMFRKPYFLEQFLPTLLKPRCLPDIPDTRMKFIAEVFKSVKLDPGLLKRYTQACEQEKQAWMEGIFSLDDEDLHIMILPPKDQLHVQLTKYCELLTSGSTKKVSETLNSVVEAVSGLLPLLGTESGTMGTSIQVDLTIPLSSVEREFVLEFTGVFQTLSTCSKQGERVCLKSAQGMKKLFSTLADHFHQFQPVLCRHVISTLTSQPMSQSSSLIKPLAWAFATLALSSHEKVNEVAMTTTETGQAKSFAHPTFQEAIFHFLIDEKRSQLNDLWRFWVCYTLFAVEYFEESDRESQMMDVAIVDPLKCSLEDIVQAFIVKHLQLMSERCGVCVGYSKTTLLRSDWCETSKLAHKLFSTDSWHALSRNLRPSLTDWIEFELKIDAKEENLPRFQRTTYLWQTSCNFLTSASCSSNISKFCSDIITLLGKGSASCQSSESLAAFVSLLTRHIYQLPCSNKGSNLWLVSVLQSASTMQLNAILRIVCSLPPYLVFCNSLHEKVTQAHIESSLSVVKQFSISDHNTGGFFTLDAIIYFLQSYASVLHIVDSAVQVDTFISQPLISLSILVHYEVLNNLYLLKELNKEKLEDFSQVIYWAESVLNGRQDSKTMKPSKNCLKARALFALVYNMTSLHDICLPEYLIKSEKESILFFLQITAVWLAMNGNTVMKQHIMLEKLFQQVVSSHGSLLIQLLNSTSPEMTSISNTEGPDQAFTQLFRDLSILQLVSSIPAHTLVKSTSENITLSLLTAFSNILTSVQNTGVKDLDTQYMACEITLAKWMRQLVDSCSSQHLQQVHLSSPSLNQPGPHVSLYLYIDEKKRQR